MEVLGIETSCDETAAAVVGAAGVRSDLFHSQEIHALYGGVVPELAARAHVEKLGTVVRAALDEAGLRRPDAVVATAGPGLIGAVLVGLCYGKALAAGWGVPFLGVNHLEGHVLSPLLEPDPPAFPFLALLVSGGHTAVYHCHALGRYERLSDTLDDAAGEAYDKVAKLMGLPYPGGPAVDALAAQGNPAAVPFPRPLPGDANFSFSGLKTAVRQHVQSPGAASLPDVCASFQAAVVDCLIARVKQASARTGVRTVTMGGGVAANAGLRAAMLATGLDVHLPARRRCTDNAAMIAHAGRLHLLAGATHSLDFTARAAWPIH